MSTVTISGSLIYYTHQLYKDGLKVLTSGNVLVKKKQRNGFTHLALPAYIMAVAAVEAFTNEVYLGSTARLILDGSSLLELRQEWLEEVDLREKMVLIARLVCGAQIRRGEPPFQDFAMLIRVRNAIVHYKMEETTPAFVLDLNQRGIGLSTKPPKGFEGRFMQPWVWEISTVEGIRWAHNTACRMVQKLIELMPTNVDEYRRRGLEQTVPYERFESFQKMTSQWADNFIAIDDGTREAWWREVGLEAD
jgi:hypothetical protein